jgi:acetylornithine deacetylase/succinyl-diaminopimelate desuccinylase-like protein
MTKDRMTKIEAPAIHPNVAAAFAHLARTTEAVTELQIELSDIPAPTGNEGDRATAVAHWLQSTGCTVSIDEVGNVIARRRGAEPGPAIALAAHLDTVFPEGQPVRVSRPGEESPYRPGVIVPPGEFHGPGIADDAAGLAGLIAVAQAMAVSAVQTEHDVLFVATVGEEGLGDLRGARHFFASHNLESLAAFITIDHPDPAVIVHRGVGSRRYAVEFTGPGGHAWGHFGRYNPVIALGEAMARIGAIGSLNGPRATYNVGVISGGRAVNAIPESARMEIDLRSEDVGQLDRLEALLREAIASGHEVECTRSRADGAHVEITSIGERPAGQTDPNSVLVQMAQRALQAEGLTPRLTTSSTDANAGMAAGIPSICLSWGGRSDNQHSVGEYFAPAGRDKSLAVLLRVVLDLAGAA